MVCPAEGGTARHTRPVRRRIPFDHDDFGVSALRDTGPQGIDEGLKALQRIAAAVVSCGHDDARYGGGRLFGWEVCRRHVSPT
jgi:hypothetical protein